MNEFEVSLFCYQTKATTEPKEIPQEPLNYCFMVSDLVSGPLGSTQHLKLRKTKHKNVRVSEDPHNHLELMIDLSFGSEKSFLILRDAMAHQDFIGIEAKKHFLKNFIEMETSRALRPFQPANRFSPRNVSIGFKNSIDKNDLSNLGIKFRSKRSNEDHSEYNLFHYNEQPSNHLFPDSNFLMINNSNRNSIGFFRGADSQFHMGLNSKNTPGKPPKDDLNRLNSQLGGNGVLEPGTKLADLCFSPDLKSKNHPQLTPLKTKMNKSKGFRDIRSRGVLKLKDTKDDLSNFIYFNDKKSKGFELTQKEPDSLRKRDKMFGNNDTPILDFKNVKEKIYRVENLKLLKPKLSSKFQESEEDKYSKKHVNNENESKKENIKKKEISFGKAEYQMSLITEKDLNEVKDQESNLTKNKKSFVKHLEKEKKEEEKEDQTVLSNFNPITGSVNTGKSTKKYDEGLLNLYSKV